MRADDYDDDDGKRPLSDGNKAFLLFTFMLVVGGLLLAASMGPSKRPPGWDNATTASSTMMTVKEGAVPGCQSVEDATKILHMVKANDPDAVVRLVQQHPTTCRWFKEGDRLYAEQKPAFNDANCMRPPGETVCYWINSGWLR